MNDLINARHELEEVADLYREADEVEKQAAKDKAKLKPALLELISEVIESEIELATKIVTVTGDEALNFDPDTWLVTNYPEYKIVRVDNDNKGGFVVELQEDVELRKFSFEASGYQFGRTIAMVGSSFDAEGFVMDDNIPDDFKHAIIEMKMVFTLQEDAARELMSKSPEVVPMLQKYTQPGKPQVRLNPIREARIEDET